MITVLALLVSIWVIDLVFWVLDLVTEALFCSENHLSPRARKLKTFLGR